MNCDVYISHVNYSLCAYSCDFIVFCSLLLALNLFLVDFNQQEVLRVEQDMPDNHFLVHSNHTKH